MRHVNTLLMLLLFPVLVLGYLCRMVVLGFEVGWVWAKVNNDDALDRYAAWTVKVDARRDGDQEHG